MKIFHHNDMDGKSAAAVVAKYKANSNYSDFIEYGDFTKPFPLEKVSNGEEVWFVDLSISDRKVFDTLLEKNCTIIWIDHHQSSMELDKHLKEINYPMKGIRRNGISGAALTYMYCYQCGYEEIPYFLKLVNDYDCWINKLQPNTDYFKLGIDSLSNDPLSKIWHSLLYKESQHIVESVIIRGKVVKNYVDNFNTEKRNMLAFESTIKGNKCAVINDENNSWVFGELYDNYPIVSLFTFDGEKYSYSIYSKGDVDCSKIAESYGGGGHPGASGFSTKELIFKDNKPLNLGSK